MKSERDRGRDRETQQRQLTQHTGTRRKAQRDKETDREIDIETDIDTDRET